MRPVALAGILASTTILGGCAGTIGGVTFSSISSFAGFASTLFTGADLGEHAASLVTGKDCRFSEGLMRDDRDVCEEPGSLATRDDFHGIFVERIDEDGTVIYAAPKYMPASVGAGENENNPDQIWAEIKTQKAKEEGERQLARAEAAQQIDVAALATGSVSSESLAFLPGGIKVQNDLIDGATASQTARSAPRPVVNAAPKKKAPAPVAVTPVDDQPAIEETTLTATLEAAKSNGQGGPLLTAATTSVPVASKLVNGEPVVIMKLGPIIGVAHSMQDTASALPTEPVDELQPTLVGLPSETSETPSPQAFLKTASRTPTLPATPLPVPGEETVAAVEPQMLAARPRTKPTPAELAVADVAAKPKVTRQRKTPAEIAANQADVYQPPAREAAAAYENSTTPDLIAAPAVAETPAEPTAAAVPAPTAAPAMSFGEPASTAPATSGPAPLYPLAQP